MYSGTVNRIALSNGKGDLFGCDAEQELLACLLIDPSRLADVEKIIGVDDLFDEIHQIIFRHMIAADALGRVADPRLLLRQLDEAGDLKRIGGSAYLSEIALTTATASNAVYYAEQIRMKSRRRRAMVTYGDAARKAETGEDPTAIQSWVDDEMQTIASKRATCIRPVGELIEKHPKMREPVIDGLLRRGETANIIAAAKMGKSWLVYSLGLSVVTGSRWLDTFQCHAGRVLLIDNELHPEVLASRIPVVADALGIRAKEYKNRLDVLSLRGQSVDLYGVARLLNRVRPDTYDLVIADALYRLMPEDVSENDNTQIMRLYNTIDGIARRMESAWVNIHHASKGSQGAKSVTDVGSGAGSQSRAADTHLVLRPHEQDGIVVLEAAVRSFPPVEPLALRWSFPVWQPEDDVDTTKLKGNLTKGEVRQHKNDQEGFTKIMDAIARDGPATRKKLEERAGIGRERLKRLLGALETDKNLVGKDVTLKGNSTREYSLPEG